MAQTGSFIRTEHCKPDYVNSGEPMKAKFTVLGNPRGKARPRTVRLKTGASHSFTPKETVQYENLIVTEYRQQVGKRFPDEALLDMRICAYFQIPKSISQKKRLAMELGEDRPAKTPDVDNILKIVADALNSIAYRDDKQIVDAQIRKFYSTQPRLEVTILKAQINKIKGEN